MTHDEDCEADWGSEGQESPCRCFLRSAWSDPHTIPLGHAHEARGGTVTPEGVQSNLFTLCQIGGVYDLLALEVERQHLSILVPWRLDSKAPTVLDYFRSRDH